MKSKYAELQTRENRSVAILKGRWTIDNIETIEKEMRSIRCEKIDIWDLSQIEAFDSAGVLLFADHIGRCDYDDTDTHIVGMSESWRKMTEILRAHPYRIVTKSKRSILYRIGKTTIFTVKDLFDYIAFTGAVASAFWYLVRKPWRFRYKETIYHIYQSGFTAMTIVALTAFLVGMVIAYQGAVQLAKFGADIFIVDTVGISMTRELGPMITAIVIAGRSGSSYTAEIGAMKLTEEIAAMRTMGFDPLRFLVVPRIVALTIALPLLVFFADIVGIAGGMSASAMQLGLSFEQFANRLQEVLDVKHYVLGIVKAPVFAFVIASIGCFRGFQVSDNTESIGLQTTASVVNAIFMVIAFDALFSVIYTEFGW